ncbi:BEACH domain-containing protein [Entamoeba marina]
MDLSYLNNTIPYLTRSEYYHDIPLDSSLYILKDGISSLLTPEKITPQRLSTLGRILSPHNLQKIDFVTIRNIMTYLKLLKHDGVNEITPSAYFVDGCNVLLNILRFNCTTELIHEFISFYKDLSTLHSGFLIDLLRSRHEPSHIYYSFSGIVSFISCSLSVEKIPESCYTFATKVRLKQLHHDAKPCIFAFNTNNYFFSLSVDGHTQTLFLDVNVISSSNNASPNPIGSPSITHVKSSIDTKLKICLNVWNDISLVHYRQTDTLKIISNNKSSNYIEVPYINLREKHIFLSIGGLDGKSNTYLSGDITYLSWNFDQVSPCEKPALYISPKSYSTIPNKSYIKITKTIKNRIITNDVKLTHWTISSATPIYSVISRCVADIFYTFGVINNVGKLLLFFLKCQLIDVPTTITLLIEVTKIAHDYIVTTSIIDDYLKSCLSFLGRGYCKDVVVYLMIDIRLWSGVDYLFDYLVSELMNKKEMLIKSQLFDIEFVYVMRIGNGIILIFLSNWIHPTHFHYLFSLLQDTNIQLPFKENLICLLLCIVKNHPESSIEMNLYIPSLLYIAQQSKRTLIFVLKLFSLLQPSSEQLTQLTNIISFFNVDSILYSSLLQCASGSFQIGFNPILIQTITSLPNQQYLFILFKLLSEQKDISKTITTDLAQFPLVLLRYIPLSFLTTITYTVLNQINYTTTLTPLLINFLLSHEPDASPLLISIIISNSQNSNITYKNSLPILFALLPYLNNIHTLSYIHFFAFASFINYQHPLPEQIILSFLKSVPTDYFSVMSQLRSTNEFKSIFLSSFTYSFF